MSATRLRVGLDASAAAVPSPTGIGTSIAQIVEALRARPELDPLPLYRLSRVRRRRHFLPGPARLYHERLSVLLARRLDVFHGLDARLPRFEHPALVATVHDLSARRPGFATERFRATREEHWEQVRARAHHVVTYTEAVREEVVRELGIPSSRVSAVPLAPSQTLAAAPNAEAEAAAKALVGSRRYVLFLGELSPRKNAVGAVEAFAASRLPETALVLAGPRTRFSDQVDQVIARLNLGEQAVQTDYLSAATLTALLNHASALLFPSRYEGFGMPVLEAFRARVPVVASLDPSVVEVAGGAALHADADDADALGEALTQAVLQPTSRADLIERGSERLSAFSWERTARELSRVYHAVCGKAADPAAEVSTCSR